MAQKWNPFSRIIGKKKEQINHNPYKEVISDTQIFYKKVQKILSNVELIEILNHEEPGKYNEASIKKLREQVDSVKDSIQNLKNSFGEQKKELATLIRDLNQDRKDVLQLKQENRKVFLKYSSRKISLQDMKDHRSMNKGIIADKERKIEENEFKIKKLGEEIGKNNSLKLKEEVAKLEFQIRSLEKGQAPRPPQQHTVEPPELSHKKPALNPQQQHTMEPPVKTAVPQPSRAAPKSPKDCIKYLQTLTEYVDKAGIYEGSTKYLQDFGSFLNDFKVINDDELSNIEKELSDPSLTKEKFINTITNLEGKIKNDIKNKTAGDKGLGDKIESDIKNKTGNHTAKIMKERANSNSQDQVTHL